MAVKVESASAQYLQNPYIRNLQNFQQQDPHLKINRRNSSLTYFENRQKTRMVLVLMESMAGTGHQILRVKPKGGEKLEMLFKDPFVDQTVLYKELKKIKTLKSS